jgi:hypothetical protein
MNIVPNLTKTGSNAGGPAPKNEIAIMIAEDILVYPPTNPLDKVSLMGNFVMKTGKTAILMYSTKSKTEAPVETEGSEDAISFKHKFMAQVPGNDTATKSWIQKITGQNLVIAHRACGDTKWEIMGSTCAPLQLKATKQDNNEARNYTLNFEAYAGSHSVPKDYTGVIPFEAPIAVSDITNIDAFEGSHFQLPATSGAIAITSLPNEDGVITLIGGGGATPATLSASTSVLLKNGTAWTADAGAVITLEIYDAGITEYLIERIRG